MRVVIAGSRSITNYQDVLDAVEYAIEQGVIPTVVISGTAGGVDTLGEQFAAEFNIPVERFPADWKQYGKRAGYLRNVQMAEQADAVIVVWDGVSKGSQHMINIAKNHNLRVIVWSPKNL